ncbi:endonuclease/exonuclease/phosphatase family protein [Pseudonocardia lacus]|uniref:endonuclease/exonuclease/phosphatase family protein n=1 Tax=Pseudonocardia lacus TaxID=2835865 RepID=UPI001BDBBE86|nr:endonuclease/exonuclease/phosphatase family protein [Pseudonocardia lacus]
MRLATYNVENLFARAKAMDTADRAAGRPVLKAFDRFTRVSAKAEYTAADRAAMIDALVVLGVLRRTEAGVRRNRDLDTAWAWLRENRGDFLVAPDNGEPRIEAGGRGDWIGWVELIDEPVDETAIRMTARVVDDVAADVLCVVEAEDRPSLVRFNDELLHGRYGRAMLIDGNDPRGIDVGLLCTAAIDIAWMRSHVDLPDPAPAAPAGKRLFSRDCPVFALALPGGETLHVLLNHLKSQSFSSGNPDPLRGRQSAAVRAIYDRLRADGAGHVAVLGDFNKGPDRDDPTRHPTLEPLFGQGSDLVDAYDLSGFDVGPRPGSFQSCSITNRLDYLLLSPELAARATGGGVWRRGLWGDPGNVRPPARWEVYPEITAAKHAASDHAAVWVDLDI